MPTNTRERDELCEEGRRLVEAFRRRKTQRARTEEPSSAGREAD